jgi:hypothetical protein
MLSYHFVIYRLSYRTVRLAVSIIIHAVEIGGFCVEYNIRNDWAYILGGLSLVSILMTHITQGCIQAIEDYIFIDHSLI